MEYFEQGFCGQQGLKLGIGGKIILKWILVSFRTGEGDEGTSLCCREDEPLFTSH